MRSIAAPRFPVKLPARLDELAGVLLWELHYALDTRESDPDALTARQRQADLEAARSLVIGRGLHRVRAMFKLLRRHGERFGIRRMVHLLWRFESIVRAVTAAAPRGAA